MAVHTETTELARESITECLDAAELLIRTPKPKGGIMGYAAALLLFSVTDALGHQILKNAEGDTWIEVLNHQSFGLNLSRTKLTKIKQWYRNPLVHAASIVPDVLITPECSGEVFDFDQIPARLRVPQFYALVKKVWGNLSETPVDPVGRILEKTTNYHSPKMVHDPLAFISMAVSGCVAMHNSTFTEAASAVFPKRSTVVRSPPEPNIRKRIKTKKKRK
jgi:hypothetical protein